MARGFVYLVAIVDLFSRKVLAWRLSITLSADFCVEALEEALARHGKPEIFNTDQESQFTSADFTKVLKAAKIAISMDGKGAWRDNVFVERLWRTIKYEEVYLSALRRRRGSPRFDRPVSGLLQSCFITPICLCHCSEEVLLIGMRSCGVFGVLPCAVSEQLGGRTAQLRASEDPRTVR